MYSRPTCQVHVHSSTINRELRHFVSGMCQVRVSYMCQVRVRYVSGTCQIHVSRPTCLINVRYASATCQVCLMPGTCRINVRYACSYVSGTRLVHIDYYKCANFMGSRIIRNMANVHDLSVVSVVY